MIVQNAFGQKEKVEELLNKSMIQKNAREIHNWMQYSFDPANMFCFYEEDILVSVLQTRNTQMNFNGQKLKVSAIELAATLPDYQKRGYFKALLDAYIEKSSHNTLISYVYTQAPKLFESRSFTSISSSKEYWILANKCPSGKPKLVSNYKNEVYLFPLYQEFLSHFDGSVCCDSNRFQQLLRIWQSSNKHIVTARDEQGNVNGFAFVENLQNYFRIHTIVYLNGSTIVNILNYLLLQKEGVQLITSQYERIDKLMKLDKPKDHAKCMFRLNNHKLFSELQGENVRNIKQVFEFIELPNWNLLI
ncbi:MAG: GNAT family N-acetyltransferase [Firmicutes bacterium]|nr:GNAT family N-acetyltransferase [Bacillota bacterium]